MNLSAVPTGNYGNLKPVNSTQKHVSLTSILFEEPYYEITVGKYSYYYNQFLHIYKTTYGKYCGTIGRETNLSIYLSIYLHFYISIYLPTCIYLSIDLSIQPSIYLYLYISSYLPSYLSIHSCLIP